MWSEDWQNLSVTHEAWWHTEIAVSLDCDPCDVVLVPNVTTAMNCVLQSLAKTMNASDNIMFFNITYGKLCDSV